MAFEQTTPIVGEPHSLDLLSDRCHVLLGNIVRMTTFSDCSVFSRHSKGVKAHWIENVESLHSLVSGDCISNRIVSNVTHVHLSGRIRIHFQTVEFGFGSIIGGCENIRIAPCLLPSNFIGCLHLFRHVESPYANHASMLSFFNPPQRIEFRGSSRSVDTLHSSRVRTSLLW